MRSTSTRLRAALLVLPMTLALSAGCDIAMADFAEQQTAEWRKSYELSLGGRVEIGNVNGKINVLTGDGNTVEAASTQVAFRSSPAGRVRDDASMGT